MHELSSFSERECSQPRLIFKVSISELYDAADALIKIYQRLETIHNDSDLSNDD